MKELICIVCPKGCHLLVDEDNDYKVTGNACIRGEEYGKNELISPMRVLTSTVIIEGAKHRRLPVKTDSPIPKGKIFEVMPMLNEVRASSPIKAGDVLIKDILGTGANIVATRNM